MLVHDKYRSVTVQNLELLLVRPGQSIAENH